MGFIKRFLAVFYMGHESLKIFKEETITFGHKGIFDCLTSMNQVLYYYVTLDKGVL